tara:strand:- start:1953 stop:2894 length:942 start_codon:yes stop_codon:yes gene_type:complete
MSKKIFNILFFPIILFGENKPIQEIELRGIITNPKQEISGMDWYNDNLFLLPENIGGYLFMVKKNELQKQLSLKKKSIQPIKTIFNTPDYSKFIPGFDGFEAIAFYENNVYVTIEADQNGVMVGYIAWGSIDPNSFEITFLEKNIQKINTPIQIDNLSYESIINHKNNLLLLYEANGSNLRKDPYQLLISLNDFSSKKIKGPNIEYRITDATKVKKNKFWAINYYWPGDKKNLKPSLDKLSKNKKTNSDQTIERLVEFKIKRNGISLTRKKPINLILEEGNSRNWEAIVRFGESGFLLATDKYPRMILAYIKL